MQTRRYGIECIEQFTRILKLYLQSIKHFLYVLEFGSVANVFERQVFI